MIRTLAGLCTAAALLAGPAAGQTTAPAPLGSWHTNSLLGFAIRRPAGAETRREVSVNELVRFNLRDAKTGAVRICMRLLQASERKEDTAKLDAYARKLTGQLKIEQGFEPEAGSPRLVMAGGKPGIEFTGTIGRGAVRLYCRDVWVLTEPKRFLVVRTTGPVDAKADVVGRSRASVGTLRFFDPTVARKRREADLARGAALLEQLTGEAISKAVAKRDYWLLILLKGRVRGFIHYAEQTARRENADGVLVTSEMVIRPASGPRTIIRQDMFASYDRKVEKWETVTTLVDEKGARKLNYELGLKQNELLALQHGRPGLVPEDSSLKVPVKIYMPLAMSPMAPRLLDRTKARTYAFAQYDNTRRNFAMRTIEVVGPKKVTISGKEFDAVLMREQMAADAPKAEVYLDANSGLPLKVVPEEGAVLQQTTAAWVRRAFSRELRLLESGGK